MEVSPPTPPAENCRRARKHRERHVPARGKRGPMTGLLGDCMSTGQEVDDSKRGRRARINSKKLTKAPQIVEKDLCHKFKSFFCHEPNRRVGFDDKPTIFLIESTRERFPPTIRGVQLKREAFWTVCEVRQNRRKWNRHTDAHKEESTGFSCDCKECQAEGEDPDFVPFDRLGIHKMLQALSEGNVPPPPSTEKSYGKTRLPLPAVSSDGEIRVPPPSPVAGDRNARVSGSE